MGVEQLCPLRQPIPGSKNCSPTAWAVAITAKACEIYKFEKIKRAKRSALAAHPERQFLDFGIGENDDMADPLVRETLEAHEVDKVENRGYADNGIAAFKESAARFMQNGLLASNSMPQRRSTTPSDPKPALAMLLRAAFINPGDVTLDDGPRLSGRRHTHEDTMAARFIGFRCLRQENGFFPDPWRTFRRTFVPGPSSWCSTIPTVPNGRGGHARLLSAGHRFRSH